MAKLTASKRRRIPKKDFGAPKSAAKSGKAGKGSYPINDKAHARAALAYGKRYLSPQRYAALKAKIRAKYPQMEVK